MRASVIFSTYNSDEWLKKVIIGFNNQTVSDFEIIIADDGSTQKTKQCIDDLRNSVSIKINHVWHEDNGFQKTKILNKAILQATTDYLIFTDGDCIPRKDFVEKHLEFRDKNYFLSGGYFKLPMSTSHKISDNVIVSQACFTIKWLVQNGVKQNIKLLKIINSKWLTTFLNKFTTTTPSWNGHNSSGWKSDIIAVNGFNEEMQYGGEDRELGERLINAGLKSKQIRYSAICLHLDHARGYVSDAVWKKNNDIREYTKKYKVTFSKDGIEKR